jgi:hypothetical protein
MKIDDARLLEFGRLGQLGECLSVDDVRRLIELARHVFRTQATKVGVPASVVTAMLTKFCDAGRRSPPTAAFQR